jgi:NAD(P)-dependent dehydrogenase (short-subunit alcohol dehydrogenase family)
MAGRGWTIDDAPRLDGRRAIVTGASGGLGFETALGLARRGAQVVLAARNPGKAEAALARIRAIVPGAAVSFSPLDLADLGSVRSFAEDELAGGAGLDILVNNAGVMAYPTRRTTRDGFEEQFGTNYLGHFALTAHLLPALLGAGSEARVVSLASLAHVKGRIALDDLQGERRYDGWTAYRQSKLAMLIFAREVQRRADAAGWAIRSVAAHPGWAVTDIVGNGPAQEGRRLQPALMSLVLRMLGQSAADGALPILYAATAAEAEPGGYYGPTGRGERTGPVGPSRVMPQAADAATARALWSASERLTGVKFEEMTA